MKWPAVIGAGAAIFAASVAFGATDDIGQLQALMSTLCARSASPASLLDPALGAESRSRNLAYLKDPRYDLTADPTGKFAIAGGMASVPVRIHFKDATTELDVGATIHFVCRSGTWYFASYDFLGLTWDIILGVILCCFAAVAYSAVVLTLRIRLGATVWSNWAWAKILIPFYWPALFRQSRRPAQPLVA